MTNGRTSGEDELRIKSDATRRTHFGSALAPMHEPMGHGEGERWARRIERNGARSTQASGLLRGINLRAEL
jgi:hypothetical protein